MPEILSAPLSEQILVFWGPYGISTLFLLAVVWFQRRDLEREREQHQVTRDKHLALAERGYTVIEANTSQSKAVFDLIKERVGR